MSPVPVLRTQFAVLRLFAGQVLPQAFFAVLVALVQVVFAVALGLGAVVLIPVLFGATMLLGAAGPVLVGVPVGLGALAVTMSCQGALWRHADRRLLGAGHGPLPVGSLTASALFVMLVLAGGGVAAAACLFAIPGRLQRAGVPADTATAAVVLMLAVAYVPLVLRLALVPALVAVDNCTTMVAWRLVLRTTKGKTVPLACAALLQVLVLAPVYGALHLAGLGAGTALEALQGTQAPSELLGGGLVGYGVAAVLAGGALSAMLAALQVAVIRHFFGFGEVADHEHSELVVTDEGDQVWATPTLAQYDPAAAVDQPPEPTPAPVFAPAPIPAPAPPAQATPAFVPVPDADEDPFAGLR